MANLGNPPTNLTRTYSSQNVDDGTGNVARKVVKFEDEVAAHLKKTVKPKPGKGDGDAGSAFVKRFSFDGKSIRDRMPYVKRSSMAISLWVVILQQESVCL